MKEFFELMKMALKKKLKVYSAIALIFGLILTLGCVSIPIIMSKIYTAQNGSIGIIGGADGPTAIFLSNSLILGRIIHIFVFGITLFLTGMLGLIFSKVILHSCTLKTTALSLTTSLFGACGLTCFVIWFSIVSFNDMSSYPFSYHFSIVGGLISLLAFIISIIFYMKARKTNIQVRGIIIDILTSVIFLPMLFLFCLKIHELLCRLV